MAGIMTLLLFLVTVLLYNTGFGLKLNKVSKRLDDIELKMLIARNERRKMHYSLDNMEERLNISLSHEGSSEGEIQHIKKMLNETKELLETSNLAEISETFYLLRKGFSAEKKQRLRFRRRISQIEDVLALQSNSSETLMRNMLVFFEDLRETHEGLRETNEGLGETNKCLTETNEGLTETNEGLRETNEGLNEINEVLRKTNEGLTETNDGLKETNKALRETNECLTETNKALRETNKALRETNEGLTETNEGLTETNKDLRETNNIMKEMYANTSNALLHVTDVLGSLTTKIEFIEHRACSEPKSCLDVLKCGSTESSVYSVILGSLQIKVFCDQERDGGGWTVFQRRQDGSVDFFRNWEAYKVGFGNLTGEFWLGNENLHRLLSVKSRYELRVDLGDFDGNTTFAKYNRFMVGSENDNYVLTVERYSGDAGDSLANHNGQKFSTKDRDNDRSPGSCSQAYKSAWWYNICHHSNLNGLYNTDKQSTDSRNICWYHWKRFRPLKFSEMKFRELV